MNKEAEILSYDVNQIMEIIPHRPPFLLIDKVIGTDSKTFVEAIKNVTVNEPFFKGHFPLAPIMPGVLIIEAAAQAAAILVMTAPQCKGKIPFFMSIDKVKFRKPVVPGDQIHIRIDVIRLRESTGKAKSVMKVGDKVVAEAILTFVIADPPKND
ncbi:3-hydroxyacyl-ACP dehydratase FabZ [bacterium]|nr:3-hydroxyacyl-ACP dehydratase FabZ [bacterium]